MHLRARSPVLPIAACAVSAVLWTAAAAADPRAPGTAPGDSCAARDSTQVVLNREHGGVIAITASPGQMTYIQLPSWLPLERVRYTDDRLLVTQAANGVEIIPRPDIPLDVMATLRLKVASGTPPIVVEMKFTADQERYTRLVSVSVEPREFTCQRLVQPHIDATVEREVDERLEDHTRKAAMAIGSQLLARDTYVPRAPVIDRTGPIIAIPGLAAWIDTDTADGPRTDFLWTFVIEREDVGSVPIVGVVLRGPDGVERYPLVEFDDPAERAADGRTIIPGRSSVTGIVQLPGADYRRDDAVTLEFFGRDRRRLAFTSAGGFDETARVRLFKPVRIPDEELERRRLERERIKEEQARRERERDARRTQVSARVHFGAFWIADGVGNGEREATSFTALGMRITKGITPMVAFEAELSGGRTGQARFADIDLGEVQGDLAQRATFGRVQLGGVLRFGYEIQPVARIGLGVQVGHFSAESTVTEVDSALEISPFLAYGGGVDLRFTNDFAGGLSLSVETLLNEGDYFDASIAAQLHLGYSF